MEGGKEKLHQAYAVLYSKPFTRILMVSGCGRKAEAKPS